MGEWTSIKDGLPRNGQRVVCVGANGGYFISSKVGENSIITKNGVWKIWDSKCKYRTFTHWLLLPELFSKEVNK